MNPGLAIPDVSVVNTSGIRLPVPHARIREAISVFQNARACTVEMLEVILVNEEGIVETNKTHLSKDYVTDIISFSYHESPVAPLEGTLFICLPRVKEQAEEFHEPFHKEFLRVMIHGLLHLNGMEDSDPLLKAGMQREENRVLSLLGYGT